MGMLAAVAAISLAAAVWAEDAGNKAADDAAKGKTVYKAKCATCHGADAKGSPAMAKMFQVPPNALDLRKKSTAAKKDEELASVISKGKGKMPAFKDKLKEEEMRGVVSLVRSLAASSPSAKLEKKESPPQKP